MELTVQNVYGLILRSKLLPIEEAKTMYARWQGEAKDAAGDLPRFAAWLVANKFVTEYQASLLVRGHADGFFLNDYKVLDLLGKGRMAGVYKVQHRLGQIFAVKVLPPSRAAEPNLLGRFQREAKLAVRLKHPNIVRAFQVGQSRGLHYLVMEYLEGETLEDVLARRKKLPPAEAVRLIFQALQGLQHIHTQGLVHRDLKPANLMLVGGAADYDGRGHGQAARHRPGPGAVRWIGGPVGGGSDRRGRAAGHAGLHVAGAGPRPADRRHPQRHLQPRLRALPRPGRPPPFPDTNIISQMIRHATEPPRPLKEFSPAVPDGLQQIVNWMLAKDPNGRYPTPDRAAQALQVFLAAGAEPLHAPESDPQMRSYLTWLQTEDGKEPAFGRGRRRHGPLARRPGRGQVLDAHSAACPAGRPAARPVGQADDAAQAGAAFRRGRQAAPGLDQAAEQEEAREQYRAAALAARRRAAGCQRRTGAAAAAGRADGAEPVRAAVQSPRFSHLRHRRRRRRGGHSPWPVHRPARSENHASAAGSGAGGERKGQG